MSGDTVTRTKEMFTEGERAAIDWLEARYGETHIFTDSERMDMFAVVAGFTNALYTASGIRK